MEISKPRDGRISIDDDKGFVDSQDVAPGESHVEGYTITGPDGHVIGIEAGTPVALEFRDSNGDPLDDSTRVTIQKANRQGNPIGGGIVFSELLSRFDYSKMRTDPDFFRHTSRDLMIDEYEEVHIYLDIPTGANDFDASESRITIGDETSDFGKPVEIVEHDDLSEQESAAVKAASQNGGN